MAPLAGYTIFLVLSASHAVKGERALAKAGIPCKLIPVPRALSSQCGVCLRVDRSDRDRAAAVLAIALIKVAGIHDLES